MKYLTGSLLILLMLTMGAWAQEMKNSPKPTEKDKTETIPTTAYLKRGAPIGDSKKVSIDRVLEDPSKFDAQTVRIEGVVVRSCKMEGCWAEIAASKDSRRSIRVKMKDHAFFIPLESAGAFARAEGVFAVKNLSKAEVEHMIKDDGAQFDDRNADGSVTEVSFVATGIELRRATE